MRLLTSKLALYYVEEFYKISEERKNLEVRERTLQNYFLTLIDYMDNEPVQIGPYVLSLKDQKIEIKKEILDTESDHAKEQP